MKIAWHSWNLFLLFFLQILLVTPASSQTVNQQRPPAADSSGPAFNSAREQSTARMNTLRRDEILSPAAGQMIFNTDCNSMQMFNGNAWVPVDHAAPLASLGQIRGNVNPCMKASGEVYTVEPLQGATTYTWKVPPGAVIVRGQGTNKITVDFGTVNGAIYVSASGNCWRSSGSYLGINLKPLPDNPAAGSHLATQTQITWNWNTVPGAQGYKFNTSNDFQTAMDLGQVVSRTETGLTGNTGYSRYVWAYFPCGRSSATALTASTLPPVLPMVNTLSAENVTATGATIKAEVTGDGGAPLLERGVCWSQNANPTTADFKSSHGGGKGSFIRSLKNLKPNTLYFVRSYATNISGTSYGKELIFRTACASYVPVSISISASSTFVCAGTPVTLNSTIVNGGAAPVYQWRVNGTNVAGATGSSYTYVPSANNIVTCQLSSNAECVTGNPAFSNAISLSVNPVNPAGVKISASSTQVCEGSPVTLSASPVYGGSTPSYQWKVNGKEISWATSSAYTYLPANNDVVTCTMTSDGTCVSGSPATSAPVSITVNAVQPVSVTISASANPFAPGSPVTFTASAVNGGSAPVYQWMSNGNMAGNNSNSFTYSPWNGDNVICIVTSNQKCISGNPAFSNSLIMAANPFFATVMTSPVKLNSEAGATSGGDVTSDGGSPVVSRGVCWSTTPNPTTANSTTSNGSGTGSFSGNIPGLIVNTQYYLRAYAVNSSGTAYGQEISFVTLPSVTTTAVGSISQNTATSGGNIAPGGGAHIASRGVCWSTKANPTILDSHTSDGTGTGIFTSTLTGLSGNTMYYVRAYAKNASGIVYGNQQTFATLPVMPSITTDLASGISLTSARCGGKLVSNGGARITSFGLCWGTAPNPTISNSKTVNENPVETFENELTGLTPNTLYYVRSYATNSEGTSYGNEITFTTMVNPVLPAVSTLLVTNLTDGTATSGGTVTSDGGSAVTSYGVCWSTSPNPTLANSFTTDGNGTGSFVSTITGLDPSTHYYFRAYAVNSVGISYGNEMEINKFRIGQSYGGGIVFYVDGTGQHGLIAATGDQSSSAPWGCYGTTVGGTSTAAGSGKSNTETIVNACVSADIAARICSNLSVNGFDDWYLPSRDELNLLYMRKEVIGGFTNNNYWSSSEQDANFTWYQSFYDGYQYKYDKYFTACVRAIRAF